MQGPEYGDTWVYESIVGALPGIDLRESEAVALQFVVFEVGIVLLALLYDLWAAALAGTAAVAVAAAGSVAMRRLGEGTRELRAPEPYRRLLFGSSIEVVLAVLAFIALVTHLFVFDPQQSSAPLLDTLFGTEPPILVVYLTLLVLWDLCYRIGTSWWAAVVALWRAWRYDFDAQTARAYRRLDAMNVLFAVGQAVLLPFLVDQPFLLIAVGGHIGAVTVVSGAAILLTRPN